MRALAYLQLRLFVNSIKHIARSPKRLIPAILLAVFVLPSLLMNLAIAVMGVPRYGSYGHKEYLEGLQAEALWSGVFALLALVVVYTLYNALSEGLLIFSASHIDFVFPSPVNRRVVLIFKLLGDYSKYAMYAGFVFLFVIPPFFGMAGGPVFPAALYCWLGTVFLLILATNVSHTLNIATTYTASRFSAAGAVVRTAILALVAATVLAGIYHYRQSGDALASLVASVYAGAARVILAPVSWCANLIVGPLTGQTAGAVLLVAALGLLAIASALVLLARPENFYEPSLGISGRMARLKAAGGNLAALRIEAMKRRRNASYSRSPVPPFGRGASALIWKNLVTRTRASRSTLAILFLLPPLLAAAVGYFAREPEIQRFSPFAMVYVVWIVSSASQQELRSEFRQVDIIKAIPASGFSVVAAQVFSQWLLVAVLTIVGALSVLVFIPGADHYFLGIATLGSLTIGFVCIAASSVPVLLYPDARDKWQLLIPTWITMIVLALVIGPSAVICAVLAVFRVNLAIIALSLIAINTALSWGALAISGRLFERFDPTAD
ncbi:MAG: putative ABC exporter domain-containing protein [Armatimonadota bacterium]|nr:putative ABC exporter domain-containing protein [Armatimonadota bacterium]